MHVRLFPFNTVYQYLYPRFRLAFFPTLYKFIVRAWVHSCSRFKLKLVLTITIEKSLRLNFSATNNKAEYETLLRGMMMVQKMGGKAVRVFSDSKLVMRQIRGDLEA